ncbi:MAG: gamma-glutamylcyclotransferase family protein [Xanthomonadales bacterium]|nr:gamma-glutamylcyclotransferase family protein [Xanthomonadales bacterium]
MDTAPVTVFFYGLFMDESLLASKGFSLSGATVGYVDGFGLRIGRRATLVPETGNRAFGVVTEMAAEAVSALYAEESVSDYVAETVSVVLNDGHRKSAVCYNLPKDKLGGTNPEYARSLLALAIQLGFPDPYLQQIRKHLRPV